MFVRQRTEGRSNKRYSGLDGAGGYCAGRFLPEFFARIQETPVMNRIIWLVGAVVIILFVLGYFGLR